MSFISKTKSYVKRHYTKILLSSASICALIAAQVSLFIFLPLAIALESLTVGFSFLAIIIFFIYAASIKIKKT